MELTWKDLLTTILAAGVVGLYYAVSKGIDLPLLSGYRSAILTLAIVGMAMCALSGGTNGTTNLFITVASGLGIISLILIVYGLITGTKIAFALLTIVILALWATATLRHLFAK